MLPRKANCALVQRLRSYGVMPDTTRVTRKGIPSAISSNSVALSRIFLIRRRTLYVQRLMPLWLRSAYMRLPVIDVAKQIGCTYVRHMHGFAWVCTCVYALEYACWFITPEVSLE